MPAAARWVRDPAGSPRTRTPSSRQVRRPAGVAEVDPVRFAEVGLDRRAALFEEGGEAEDSPRSIP